jgi:carbonic anhydrase
MKKTIISLFVASIFIVGCEDCSMIEQNILMTKNQIQLKKDELAKINNNEEWLKIKPEVAQKEKESLELKQQVDKLKKEVDELSLKIIQLSRKR